jgi:hypothetical protein
MTSSPLGDLLSFLPGLKQLHKETGKKSIVYQRIGAVGTNHVGVPNAFQNADGNDILFSDKNFELVKPLLLAQPYIQDFIKFDGQEHQIAIDDIRTKVFTNQPLNSINRWPSYLVPQMNPDLSETCIEVPKIQYSEKIYVNFTPRFRNGFINYFFLKKYDNIVFLGLEKEYESFTKEYNLSIPLEPIKDFLDLAEKIAGCKFFVSNQSSIFQIAEWLKIPRILEEYAPMPNVIPIGENAAGCLNQSAMEFFVDKFSKL